MKKKHSFFDAQLSYQKKYPRYIESVVLSYHFYIFWNELE